MKTRIGLMAIKCLVPSKHSAEPRQLSLNWRPLHHSISSFPMALFALVSSVTHQTSFYSPDCSKTNLVMPGCGEEKCDIYCRVPSQESRWLMLKKPELPHCFQGSFLKTGWEKGNVSCVISLWKFFWLVDGEVIQSQHHHPSSSSWSGVYVPVGSIQLTSSGRGFSICKTTQRIWLQMLSVVLEGELNVFKFV